MDHIQTQRLREQIVKEEHALEAWTMKYLSETARAQFTDDASHREGQYPPKDVWKGGPVQQPLDPTAVELAAETALARALVEQNKVKHGGEALAHPTLDLSRPVPPGYIRSSRLTHDTRTEALLQDLSPALVCPGAVYVKQRFTTSSADAYTYNRAKIDPDGFAARNKFALRRTWAQQHAEKCLMLGEKPFVSGGTAASKK
ncbi:hypothetical protein T492DRAFT_1069117 [Pavlovales sp. CCMP2436]|nr:hypothetical protein T492DRAFT_1069117 [Pavlovales sp. CCMP2436]